MPRALLEPARQQGRRRRARRGPQPGAGPDRAADRAAGRRHRLPDPACRHGRLLRQCRVAASPGAARPAGDRRRRGPRGGALGDVRGARLRRPQRDADAPCPAAVSARGRRPPRLRRLLGGLRRGDGRLPVGHPAGGAAVAGRGLPRRLRRPPPARPAALDRGVDPGPDRRRAGHHLLRRGRGDEVPGQARLLPLQARRPAGRAGGRRPAVPAPAAGGRAVGGRRAHRRAAGVGRPAHGRRPRRAAAAGAGAGGGRGHRRPPARAGRRQRPAPGRAGRAGASRWARRRRSVRTWRITRSSTASCSGWPSGRRPGCGRPGR